MVKLISNKNSDIISGPIEYIVDYLVERDYLYGRKSARSYYTTNVYTYNWFPHVSCLCDINSNHIKQDIEYKIVRDNETLTRKSSNLETIII